MSFTSRFNRGTAARPVGTKMVGSLQSKLLSGRQPLWRGHKKGSPFIYYSERISVALSESATTIFVPLAKVGIFFVTTKLLWQKLYRAGDIVPF
jgi:hypothetical protein